MTRLAQAQVEEFVVELRALLNKYEVTLSADDHWQGYAECGQDVRITADFENGEIDFGSHLDSDSDIEIKTYY